MDTDKKNELRDFDSLRRRGLRPQIVACFLHKKKILFFFKKEHELWQLPQGGIDNHENLEKAFVREINEELGKNFLQNCEIVSISTVHEDEIYFSEDRWNVKELFTDDGKPVSMRGKKYFFLAIEIGRPKIRIDETEFDDCRWLSFDEAMNISQKIYQKGKKRITQGALNTLRNTNLL
ncbi:MAG TPA: NUDIX hydrolase [Candidatus Bathyarchaeia archaeon]|nr:NUDIX hydrolase [Candidatus Bathyarchaeia archaeon]